jgi:hypothetical protein
VRKVRASVGYPFVNVIERLFTMPVLVPLGSVFGRILEFLRPLEVSFIFAVEAWVLNLLAIRQGCKRL